MTVPPALQPRFNAARPYAAPGTGILSLSLSAMFVRWADALGAITIFYRLLLAALILFPFFVRCCRTNHTLLVRHSQENHQYPRVAV